MNNIQTIQTQRNFSNTSIGGEACFRGSLGGFPCLCNACEKQRNLLMRLIGTIMELPKSERDQFWGKVEEIQKKVPHVPEGYVIEYVAKGFGIKAVEIV